MLCFTQKKRNHTIKICFRIGEKGTLLIRWTNREIHFFRGLKEPRSRARSDQKDAEETCKRKSRSRCDISFQKTPKKVKKDKYKRKRGDIIVYHHQIRLSLVCQKVDIICH